MADVSEEEEVVEEVEDPFKDIYDQLDGKTFYKNIPSAAYAIYFYEDGYFDTGYRTGNGDYRGIYLANGKHTYKNNGDFVVEVVSIGGDGSDKLDTGDIYLYLPHRKRSEMSDTVNEYLDWVMPKEVDDYESMIYLLVNNSTIDVFCEWSY
ncbi:MAG: hypothetical protein PUI05_07330 [Peptoniphilaceae bacterium]|nr:hypothetical protein [Peptoniphilaceae bacterium]